MLTLNIQQHHEIGVTNGGEDKLDTTFFQECSDCVGEDKSSKNISNSESHPVSTFAGDANAMNVVNIG